MAKQLADVRTAFYGIALLCGYLGSTPIQAQDLGTPHGTTQGMVHANPEWSLGLQIGAEDSTGVSAQRMGFAGGAANFGLGFWAGDLAISADYLWFFAKGFASKVISAGGGYSVERGHLLPYAGAGLQLGDGIYFRIPLGVQYTLLKDPINLYGGVSVLVGSDINDNKNDIGVKIGALFGVRLLI